MNYEFFQHYLGFTDTHSIFEYKLYIDSNQRQQNLKKIKDAS